MDHPAFPLYRLVAAFADGARLTFDGASEAAARALMEAAQSLHGCITWWDGVTDANYENGLFWAAVPSHASTIAVIDLSDQEE